MIHLTNMPAEREQALRKQVKEFFQRVDNGDLTLRDMVDDPNWPKGAWQLIGAKRPRRRPKLGEWQGVDGYKDLAWRWWRVERPQRDGIRHKDRTSHLVYNYEGHWRAMCGHEMQGQKNGAIVLTGLSPAGVCNYCSRRARDNHWPLP